MIESNEKMLPTGQVHDFSVCGDKEYSAANMNIITAFNSCLILPIKSTFALHGSSDPILTFEEKNISYFSFFRNITDVDM